MKGLWLAPWCMVAAQAAAGQSVLLSIRPHPGDTLHMRYDQRVETIGRAHREGLAHADSTTTIVTTLLVMSRTIVETTDTLGSDVVAVTDSVATTTTGPQSFESPDLARRLLQGKPVHLRLAPDGATTVADDSSPADTRLRALFAAMPAVLPRQPIAVGKRWSRTMAGPMGGAFGHGELKTTFRLDSVARGGDLAYLSVRGTISTVESSGTLAGTMLVDLRRGWLTSSRATIEIHSVVASVHVQIIVTQWLRTID